MLIILSIRVLYIVCNINDQESPRWSSCQGHSRWTLVVSAWPNIPDGSMLCIANPFWCCRAGVASAWGVILTVCKRWGLPSPFPHLQQIPMVWMRLSRLLWPAIHKLYIFLTLTNIYHAGIRTTMNGVLGWKGYLQHVRSHWHSNSFVRVGQKWSINMYHVYMEVLSFREIISQFAYSINVSAGNTLPPLCQY